MAKAAGVVSIDGVDYDMASGQAIGSIKKAAKLSTMPTAAKVIDGFIKKSVRPEPPKPKAKIAGAKVVSSKRIPTSRQNHKVGPASAIHRRAQHSKTLMRRSLSRPTSTVRAATRTLTNPAASLHKVVDPAKLARAKMVTRSNKISRFPKEQADHTPTHKKSQAKPVAPRNTASTNFKAHLSSTNSMVVSTSHQRLERMLDIALAKADAHKRAHQSKRSWQRLWLRSRWMGVAVVCAAALMGALLFTWRDIPSVAIKLADLRAHVPATLPAYTPAGYHYTGPLSYGTGRVTLVYKDRANPSQAYSLSQQKSDWDSTTLKNSISNSKYQVQSSQAGGLTVYTYNGNSSATWVNNGMLYYIQNKASLSSDQILNIAQSL